jgi:hypothetical protein
MAYMAGESKTTTDHEVIKKWIEDRGGEPAVVKGTEDEGKGVGVLRVNFPDYSGKESLEKISWEQFFDTFEEKKLAFLYQDELRSGETSRFFKFVSRE